MPKMTRSEKLAFARVVKRQAQFFADMPLLTSLLDTYAAENKVPTDWREVWHQLQQGDTYKAILAEFQPLIESLESEDDETEAIQLLQRISEKMPQN